jgi:hypothetical protein
VNHNAHQGTDPHQGPQSEQEDDMGDSITPDGDVGVPGGCWAESCSQEASRQHVVQGRHWKLLQVLQSEMGYPVQHMLCWCLMSRMYELY